MKTKIAITGGSGFIGQNLSYYYLQNGFDVLNIDIKPPIDNELKALWKNVDIRDFEKLKRTLLDFEPKYILHMAARTDLDGKTLEDYSTNIKGTDNLIKVCSLLIDLERIIFTSSKLVMKAGFDNSDKNLFSTTTIYGESKAEMERIIRQKANKTNYDWAIVRPTSIWGPYFDVPYRNFFDLIIKGSYFHFGNKASTKTYGYVRNTVFQIDSLLFAPSNKIRGEVFYLGDYEPTDIKLWADQIAEELGIKIKNIPFFMIKIAAWIGDILKKFRVKFPMTSFRLKNMTTNDVINLKNMRELAPNLPFSREEGVRETIAWIKQGK